MVMKFSLASSSSSSASLPLLISYLMGLHVIMFNHRGRPLCSGWIVQPLLRLRRVKRRLPGLKGRDEEPRGPGDPAHTHTTCNQHRDHMTHPLCFSSDCSADIDSNTTIFETLWAQIHSRRGDEMLNIAMKSKSQNKPSIPLLQHNNSFLFFILRLSGYIDTIVRDRNGSYC